MAEGLNNEVKIIVTADTSPAKKEINGFKKDLNDLSKQSANVNIKVNKGDVKSQADAIKSSFAGGVAGGVKAGLNESKKTIKSSSSSLGTALKGVVIGGISGSVAGRAAQKSFQEMMKEQGLSYSTDFKEAAEKVGTTTKEYNDILNKIYGDMADDCEKTVAVIESSHKKVARLRGSLKSGIKKSDLFRTTDTSPQLPATSQTTALTVVDTASDAGALAGILNKLKTALGPVKKVINGIGKSLAEAAKSGLSFVGGIVKAHPVLAAIAAVLAVIKIVVGQIKKTYEEVVKITKTFLNIVKQIETSMLRVTVQATKLLASFTLLSTKVVAKSMLTMLKGVATTLTTIGRLLKYSVITPAVAGLEAVYSLFGNIFSLWQISFAESVGNIYTWGKLNNNVLTKSLDLITTDLWAIQNALASMVMPIIEKIAPLVDIITDKILVLTNAIAKLFAQLSGKSSYVKVTKAAREFTDANNQAAQSLKKVLLNIDELNKLDDSDISDVANAFKEETTAIDKLNLSDFEFGVSFGEKLKEWLDDINWDVIQQKASDIGTKLANILNGIFSVKDLGSTFGNSLAEVVNTAFSFLNSYIHTINIIQITQQISDMVRRFFTDIDYPSIYSAVTGLAQNIVDSFNTFVEDEERVSAVANGIANMFRTAVAAVVTLLDGLNINQLAENIVTELNALFGDQNTIQSLTDSIFNFMYKAVNGLLTLVNQIQWENVVTALINSLNTLFGSKEKINTLAEQIHQLFVKAVETVSKLVKDINWDDIVTAIITTLNKLFTDKARVTELATSILTLFDTAVRSLLRLINELRWDEVVDDCVEAINKFLNDKERSNSVAEHIYNMFERACSVVTRTIKNLDWVTLVDNITTYIGNAIKGLDGQEVADAVVTLFNAALQLAIKTPWAELAQFGSDVLTRIIDEMPTVFKNVPGSQIASKISEALNIIIDAIQPDKIAATVNEFVDWVADFWETIKEKVDWDELVEKLCETISEVDWAKALQVVFDVIARYWNFKTMFKIKIFEDLVSDICNAITNAFDGKASGLIKGIGKIIETAISITNPFYSIIKSAQNAVKAVKKIFSDSDYGTSDSYDYDASYMKNNSGYKYYAAGGVVTQPTRAIVGEYAGAKTNPEIITPESKMREVFMSGNSELANVYIQVGQQIISAIQNQSLEVSIGDDTIAKSAARGNNSYRMMTGQSLFA